MSLRVGYVVAVHPEDHSVDALMADNGERLIGVQVLTHNGSTRTGRVDLPDVPYKKDKWDITQLTGQDMKAVIGYVGRTPVVTGFLYPQVNQMLFKDPKLRVDRHQSDVTTTIDGDGNIQLTHPSGTYVRIGEEPDKVDIAAKNADASTAFDRNTGRRVHIRIGLAGGVLELTMTPTGEVDLQCDGDINVHSKADMRFEAAGLIQFKAPSGMTFDTPNGHFSNLATANTDFVAADVSLAKHPHPGVTAGPDKTEAPAQTASSAGPEW